MSNAEPISISHTCVVGALDQLIAARAELAALKARRCEGCAWWRCNEKRPTGLVGSCGSLGASGIHADFACNAWRPRVDLERAPVPS